MATPSPVSDADGVALRAEATSATLDAWRARGNDGFDPVRFRLIEALARRATAHHGATRRLLDDKISKLMAAYGEALAKAASAADARVGPATPDTAATPVAGGALAQLVNHIARAVAHRDGSPGAAAAAATTPHGRPGPAELQALSYFRNTWSRLSADRRMSQSLATVPENAGPLNSHHLVHHALTLMRDLSPAYLSRFMAYVDTLLWLEQAHGASAASGNDGVRVDAQKKSGRGRAR